MENATQRRCLLTARHVSGAYSTEDANFGPCNGKERHNKIIASQPNSSCVFSRWADVLALHSFTAAAEPTARAETIKQTCLREATSSVLRIEYIEILMSSSLGIQNVSASLAPLSSNEQAEIMVNREPAGAVAQGCILFGTYIRPNVFVVA